MRTILTTLMFASVLGVTYYLFQVRSAVSQFENMELEEVRLFGEVTLEDVCSEIRATDGEQISIVIDPAVKGRRVSSFCHGSSVANDFMWGVANAFGCEVEFKRGRMVVFREP